MLQMAYNFITSKVSEERQNKIAWCDIA